MRENIEQYSVLLKDDNWVQLRKMVKPPLINGYTYSHEKRCNGEIVAFLPYKIEDNKIQILLRNEAVPCWEIENKLLSAFTGGMEEGFTPKELMLKELKEEAGVVNVEDKDIIDLGTSFATKSTDTTYYLFAINITDNEPSVDLFIESELEKTSDNTWVPLDSNSNELINLKCPIAGSIILKLLFELNKRNSNDRS